LVNSSRKKEETRTVSSYTQVMSTRKKTIIEGLNTKGKRRIARRVGVVLILGGGGKNLKCKNNLKKKKKKKKKRKTEETRPATFRCVKDFGKWK